MPKDLRSRAELLEQIEEMQQRLEEAEALINAIVTAKTDGLVRGARLFDIYKPKTPVAGIADNERSLAVRVELRDDEQTLTDERIEAAMAAVIDALSGGVNARVRA